MSDRNTRVVIALIFAMTVGAGALFLLDGTIYWPGATPLTAVAATRPRTIESVEIRYVRADAQVEPAQFDYVVYPMDYPERLYVSKELRSQVRVGVIGSGAARLDESQQSNLLNVLGALRRARGFSLSKVNLAADSDPRVVESLPQDARHLCSLLIGRGIIR